MPTVILFFYRYFHCFVHNRIHITRLLENYIIGTRSELIHFNYLVSFFLNHSGHFCFGIVVPITSFGILQVYVIVTICVLYHAITPVNQHSFDVVYVLLRMGLCKEWKCVPTENKVATILWYVGTFCVLCTIKHQIFLMCRWKHFSNWFFHLWQYIQIKLL